MRVLISPSYGSSATRRHWTDTVDHPVAFADDRYAHALTADQRARLQAVHPDGTACFWGAVPKHDTKLRDVVPGDVVLFTGQNKVRAVGEIGAIFRNAELADLLWPPKQGDPSWHTIYTVLDLAEVDIPYTELNAVLGYRPQHTHPGLKVLRDDKAQSVLDAFMITSGLFFSRACEEPISEPTAVDAREAVRRAAAEEMRTSSTSYRRAERLVIVDRREARLVAAYREHLASCGRGPADRFYCRSGISDLYVDDAEGSELIEAKSDVSHQSVRQALGQLLDYAPYCPAPPDRLSALLPSLPARADLALLHRYGIDCIHRDTAGVFVRAEAPAERRELMRSLWSS
ncbi:hypothetical protein GKJPGBOP_02131 [Streptomyces paromomycinus]|uniref:Uncharacterized protein n=1 Tax=Streptomyces paromomycinus TaxID=92743 RepID=A0A401VZI5_STREY|nr:hypothetical protein GKJPGBOP_02131 [Streptomyces paromomycinus]